MVVSRGDEDRASVLDLEWRQFLLRPSSREEWCDMRNARSCRASPCCSWPPPSCPPWRRPGPGRRPVAKREPHPTTIHGHTLQDDYFGWPEGQPGRARPLRPRMPTPRRYDADGRGTGGALREMIGRIKRTDLSVPARSAASTTRERRRQAPLRVPAERHHGRHRRDPHLNALAEGHSFSRWCLRRQRRRKPPGIFDGLHRLPPVRPAGEGSAVGKAFAGEHRTGRLGRLGEG